MTNILFGMAIGIAMSASILGAYRWMVWHGYIWMPSLRVRELVNEYARLKAELKDTKTEDRGKAIWNRMGAIDLELAELNYVLIETARAAYVFPIDDYHVATFGHAPAHRTGALHNHGRGDTPATNT